MAITRQHPDQLICGLVSISDRASQGTYQDQGIPALKTWLTNALTSPVQFIEKLIPDEQTIIESTLIELSDELGCDLILTTGGTGPSRRDITPEATKAVGHKEMPGFGEQMRQISLAFVPTSILSRQTAVIREPSNSSGSCLIVNLPGQPKAIQETLEGLRDADGHVKIPGIFAAIPYCIQLLNGPYVETNPDICKAFRPKTAIRTPSI